jgi:cytidine deaminase
LLDAYEPYSKFKVGAAVLMCDGTIFTGFNIENASYPAGICAERTALGAAISAMPHESISAIAISYVSASGRSVKPITPCGVCRQYMHECEKRNAQNIVVLCAGMEGEVWQFDACADLLPFGFDASSLV